MKKPFVMSRRIAFLLGLGSLVAIVGCAGRNDADLLRPDMILHNGKIVTVDKKFSIAQAVAIKSGRFVAVGEDNKIIRLKGSHTEVLDLEGRTVLPGFNDPHEHFTYNLGMVEDEFERRFRKAASVEEIVSLVKERVSRTARGELVWFYLGPASAELLKEKRFPNRHQLDAVAPNNPVLLEFQGAGDYASANSMALAKAGITRSTPQPYSKGMNGEILKDASGEPNGLLLGRGAVSLPHNALVKHSVENLVENIRMSSERAVRYGITTIGDPNTYIAGLPDNVSWVRAYQRVSTRGDAKVRVNCILRVPIQVRPVDEILEWLDNLLYDPGFGNETLHFGQMKLVIFDSTPNFKVPHDDVKKVITAIHRAGWQLFIHARGGEALDLAVEGLDEALKAYPRANSRHIITHAVFPTDKNLEVMKRNGIMVEPQSGALFEMSDDYEQKTANPARSAYGPTPLKTYLKNGIAVMTGSDDGPMGPLFTIFESVTRLRHSGKVINPDERISLEEAIRATTITGAYSTFQEDLKGSIEAGKLADLVVLGRDILTVPPEEIKDIPVMRTMMNGKFVYTNPNKDARQPVEYWFRSGDRTEVLNIAGKK